MNASKEVQPTFWIEPSHEIPDSLKPMTPNAAQFSAKSAAPLRTVLFLCTGNYYRSRFAEELFNHLADECKLPYRATSLGFTPHPDINPGSMSQFALRGLSKLGIAPRNRSRMPAAVTASDFDSHPRCVALCDREHRPMMKRMFPNQFSKVEFWQVEDLGFEPPERALAAIEQQVRNLIAELSAGEEAPVSV